MKKVEYKDKKGRKFLVEVPPGLEHLAKSGVRMGPPDLECLGLPIKYERRLNNQLYDRKLFTLADVRLRPEEIRAALQAVFMLDVQTIWNLYKEV